ncbi:unnamed protein product [Prunus brigantina]
MRDHTGCTYPRHNFEAHICIYKSTDVTVDDVEITESGGREDITIVSIQGLVASNVDIAVYNLVFEDIVMDYIFRTSI